MQKGRATGPPCLFASQSEDAFRVGAPSDNRSAGTKQGDGESVRIAGAGSGLP